MQTGDFMTDFENKVTVKINGKFQTASKGAKLSSLLFTDMPCGGHGRCGKCKVKAYGGLSELTDAEAAHLTQAELKSGVRLACMTCVEGDAVIEALPFTGVGGKILTSGDAADFPLEPAFKKYGAAVDIGTTTLAARLYNADGKALAETGMLNPQISFGADVISRIESALKGSDGALANSVSGALDGIIRSLANTAGIPAKEIESIVITGNTAMLYLLTNTSVEPLSHAPFRARRLFGEVVTAQSLKLRSVNPDTKIYLPDCISAFVGADTVCALISTGIYKSENTELLTDIGTNGEIALKYGEKLTVCSTAAGPAFEGVGISMGMRGELGAIDRVKIENGVLKAHVIGDTAPRGLCGSGLIDAVACLLDTGVLDETGYLNGDSAVIAPPVVLKNEDIRAVQLAKSAICAGINTLLKASSLSPESISSLYVAGGFGSCLNMENAGKIGLIPKPLVSKVKVAGNAALSGAAILLLNKSLRKEAAKTAKTATVLELSANPVFANEYMENMLF